MRFPLYRNMASAAAVAALAAGCNQPVFSEGDPVGTGSAAGSGTGTGTMPSTGTGTASDTGSDTGTGTHTDGKRAALEIMGLWNSQWGSELITSSEWNGDAVVQFDNAANVAITQAPANAEYNPGKFSRRVWTEATNGSFYYCLVDYALDTAEAALASTKVADAKDPEKAGCGTFAWTKLSAIELVGVWKDDFGTYSIGTLAWGSDALQQFDNDKNFAIVRTPADAKYSPGTYSRLVWTEPKDGAFYYCTIDFGLTTLDEAKNTTKTADSTDPEKGGCGTFPWSKWTMVK